MIRLRESCAKFYFTGNGLFVDVPNFGNQREAIVASPLPPTSSPTTTSQLIPCKTLQLDHHHCILHLTSKYPQTSSSFGIQFADPNPQRAPGTLPNTSPPRSLESFLALTSTRKTSTSPSRQSSDLRSPKGAMVVRT